MAKKMVSFWQVVFISGVIAHMMGAVASISILSDSIDFGSYYLAAWAVRNGVSLYNWDAVIKAATEANMAMASNSSNVPYVYPPLLAYLLLPLTFFSYRTAQVIYIAAHIPIVWLSARMLSNLFKLPLKWSVLIILTFSPFTLSLAFGNISTLMLPAILGLSMAVNRKEGDSKNLFFYSFASILKLFPLAWLFTPLIANMRQVIGKSILLLVILILLSSIANPTLMLEAPAVMVSHAAPEQPGLSGNASLWKLVGYLTLPTDFSYQRSTLNVERHWSPLLPLSASNSRLMQYSLAAIGVVIALLCSVRLVHKQKSLSSLWFTALSILLLQPFVLYHYLIIAIPAIVSLTLSSNVKLKTAAGIAYLLIGLGRFRGLVGAAIPYPVALIGVDSGLIALAILSVSLYVQAHQDYV